MKTRDLVLSALILAALVAGVLFGQFALHAPTIADNPVDTSLVGDALAGAQSARAEALDEATNLFQELGSLIFIRPLKMLVVPIVFIGVVVGVVGIGRADKLGILGGATLGYYITTMAAAITVGLVLVSIVKPGAGADASLYQASAQTAYEGIESRIANRPEGLDEILIGLGKNLIPDNPVAAAADGDTLPLVTVALLLGLALLFVGEAAKPVKDVFEGLFQALIKIVLWVIWLAVPGVFFLVAGRVGEVGFSGFTGPILTFSAVVLAGLLIHMLITLPAVLAIFGRTNPYVYMWKMRKALLTAFSTSSSAATLPITIEESETVGGCSKRAANFVLPLGATVNMDGTALYIAVVVSFLFALFGYDLTFMQYAIILFTATLAAVGTAAVPSASLVLMAIVIGAVNNSLGAVQGADGGPVDPLPLYAIGVIVGVDRMLDMCRTCVNVWGDAVGARVITRLAPDE